MKTIALSLLAVTALGSVALAGPAITGKLSVTGPSAEQVRLVCNEYGRCWRTRGPRYVQRDYDDGYYPRRSYYGGPQYYGGNGYYGGGPSIGFSFGTPGW